MLVKYDLEKLENNEYLARYYVYKEEEYVVSFYIEEDKIDNIHIENIDKLSDVGIERAYHYFKMIKKEVIKKCKEL